MSLLFCDGFDGYPATSNLGGRELDTPWQEISNVATTGGINTVSSTRAGGQALHWGTNAAGLVMNRDTVDCDSMVCGIAVHPNGNIAGDFPIFRFLDYSQGSAAVQCCLMTNFGSRGFYLRVPDSSWSYSGSTRATLSSLACYPANGWFYVEAKVVPGTAGNGSITVRVNGQTVVDALTRATRCSNGSARDKIRGIGLGSDSSFTVPGVLLDDFYCIAVDGNGLNDFLGDCGVRSFTADSAGDYQEFGTLVGADTAPEAVADASWSDTNASYVSGSTVNQRELFSISHGLGGSFSGDILGVQIQAVMKKDDSSSRSVRPVLRLGISNYTFDEQALSESWQCVVAAASDRPGGGSWAFADLATLQAGVKIST